MYSVTRFPFRVYNHGLPGAEVNPAAHLTGGKFCLECGAKQG